MEVVDWQMWRIPPRMVATLKPIDGFVKILYINIMDGDLLECKLEFSI